ncbi:MAG: hypothetical protein AAGC60_02865 [Acidobacteriota bacterium]
MAPEIEPDGPAQRPTALPPWARALGIVLTLASLGFVGWRLAASDAWQLRRLTTPEGLAVLVAASVVYGAVCLLLVLAWRRVLGLLAEEPGDERKAEPPRLARWLPGFDACLGIYGRSQIAKYLPGNVFHLAGRQVLAQRAGVPARVAGLSLALEHLGLVAAAAALALALPSALSPGGPWLSAATVAALGLAACALPLLAQSAARRGAVPWLRLPPIAPRRMLAAWLQVIAWQLLFFLGVGLLLFALVRSLVDATLPLAVFAFAPAWLLGLVTPGAAAGVGVREAVLILLLENGGLPADDALLAALALRLVTTLGDVVFLGLGVRASSADATAGEGR